MKMTDPTSIIVALFEQLMDWHVARPDLPSEEAHKYGMLFTADVSCNNFGYENDGSTHHREWEAAYRKFLHIIILRPRQVFVAISNEPSWKAIPLDEFENTSNHDSCWRTDGLRAITNQYFTSHDACFSHMPDEHKQAPCYSSAGVSLIPLFGPLFRFVKADTELFDDGSYHHKRKITSLKEVQFSYVLKEDQHESA